MEVFAVATYKSLPLNHPIYRLLFPHIKNVISLNEKSRTGLFGANGLLLGEFLKKLPWLKKKINKQKL